MHGTGLLTAILNLMGGGCCVTLTKPSFDPEELFETIERRGVQSVVIVGDAFAWEGGSGRFREQAPAETPFDTNVLYTADVILKGISRMAGFESIQEAMQGLDNRLTVRRPTALPLERLTLSPSHGFVLSRIDGRTSLNDLIAILPPGEESVRGLGNRKDELVHELIETQGVRVFDGTVRWIDALRAEGMAQAFLERHGMQNPGPAGVPSPEEVKLP